MMRASPLCPRRHPRCLAHSLAGLRASTVSAKSGPPASSEARQQRTPRPPQAYLSPLLCPSVTEDDLPEGASTTMTAAGICQTTLSRLALSIRCISKNLQNLCAAYISIQRDESIRQEHPPIQGPFVRPEWSLSVVNFVVRPFPVAGSYLTSSKKDHRYSGIRSHTDSALQHHEM